MLASSTDFGTHQFADEATTAEALYVGMTRGRHANHAWVSTTPAGGDAERHQYGPSSTPGQVLRQALATSGLERSATEQLADLTRRVTTRQRSQTPPPTVTAAHSATRPVPLNPTLHR